METDSALPLEEIKLGEPTFWDNPEPRLRATFEFLRRDHPVTFHEEFEVPLLGKGPGFWAITRHADVLHVSRNPEIFCSSRGGVNIVDQPPQLNEFFGSMIVMDDPRHTRLRRIVSRGFTPGMLRKTEADVDRAAVAIVDAIIDRGECDFVADIAAALPLKIICDMMGIPDSQYAMVYERTNKILGAADPEYVADLADAVPAIFQAGQELSALMADLAQVRRERPTEDLTSALVHADVDGERLTEQEIGSFFILLVVAGNETTRNAISHGMKALCDFPEQRRRWAADFERIAPTAVEEIVRWATPVTHFRRTATRDTEIAGQPIKADEKVVMFYGSANRDSAVFDRPYDLDLERSPNEHVGFGGPGPHFCLGAHLARREITVMFRQILRRLPDLRITGDAVPLKSFLINGIKRMPCAFTPGGGAGAV